MELKNIIIQRKLQTPHYFSGIYFNFAQISFPTTSFLFFHFQNFCIRPHSAQNLTTFYTYLTPVYPDLQKQFPVTGSV